MSLLPPDPPERPIPEQITNAGPWGGPVYRYRGAEIRCMPGGHVCALYLDGHPLTGRSFGVVGTITPLVDIWLDEKRLPDYMRAVPDQISRWVPGDYSSLGTDGFGFSDTRAATRRFFHIDAPSIVLQALTDLAARGEVGPDVPGKAAAQYGLV